MDDIHPPTPAAGEIFPIARNYPPLAAGLLSSFFYQCMGGATAPLRAEMCKGEGGMGGEKHENC